VGRITKTWPTTGVGKVELPVGYFANVIDIGGTGLALTADGVGTKLVVAQMLGRYDTLGIDCVAMNVNDLLCVGATPLSMVDYIAVDERLPGLTSTLGEELLRPTHIYVREIVELLGRVRDVRALIHITSDGLFNLTRVHADVGYVIEQVPPEPPIFSLIRERGDISYAEMFRVYNMGVGFCVVVPPGEVDSVFSIMRAHQRKAFRMGYVVADAQRRVSIVP